MERPPGGTEQTLPLEQSLAGDPDQKSALATYLQEREAEKESEPDHTEVLNKRLQEADVQTQKTYRMANASIKKTTKFVIKNKQAQFQ